MARLTTDPTDPDLTHGPDIDPAGQASAYLVLSEADRAEGFLRPVRESYLHLPCSKVTTMSRPIAETYARDPGFYGATYCTRCGLHRPVVEFVWLDDGSQVGS
jgi:hypothetical protein